VATAERTTDHDEIRSWVESKGGRPAFVEGTDGMLRVDFGEPDERLDRVTWDRWFDVFDRSNVTFLYDPQGYMVKFVEGREMAGRRKTGGRKKTTASRGRKKTTTRGRKKTTARGGRKKTTARGGRKKTTARGGRKKTTRKKSSGRKYGPKAGRKVERTMHEMKRGELKSGRSGKKVRSRKQAIAIGLSEARRSGAKVPPNPNRKRSRKRS
jgi:hypothetical protein